MHTVPTPASPADHPRVRDLMTHRVVTARTHDTLAYASQILLWRGIRHLPVVDADENLVGIISDRDLLRHVVEGPAGSLPLSAIMRTPVEVISPDADIEQASAMLAVARIDALPVVKRGKVLGILTSADVLAERGKLVHKGGAGRIPTAVDVMHSRVLVAHPGDRLVVAIQKLVDAGVRHLPVVDDDFRVVGILSDRDVRTAVGDPRSAIDREEDDFLAGLTVQHVMTAEPVCVPPTTSVLQLAELLLDGKIGAVPIVSDDDKLLGIVSYVDVIAHFTGRRG
jgi:CBS domain-containing protein